MHFADAIADQVLDLLGGIRRSGCKVAYLGGHNGEPAPLLTCAGCFDRGIERQQVGLKCDFVDYTDDLGNLVRRPVDLIHRSNGPAHHLAALLGQQARTAGNLIGLLRVVSIVANR